MHAVLSALIRLRAFFYCIWQGILNKWTPALPANADLSDEMYKVFKKCLFNALKASEASSSSFSLAGGNSSGAGGSGSDQHGSGGNSNRSAIGSGSGSGSGGGSGSGRSHGTSNSAAAAAVQQIVATSLESIIYLYTRRPTLINEAARDKFFDAVLVHDSTRESFSDVDRAVLIFLLYLLVPSFTVVFMPLTLLLVGGQLSSTSSPPST